MLHRFVMSGSSWRRVSDWKRTVLLVDIDDVTPDFFARHGVVRPDERVRASFPSLARLASETRFVRVNRSFTKLLHEVGVTTYEVGYHRGSDALYVADGNRSDPRRVSNIDMGSVVAILVTDEDDDLYDRMRDDAVDAVLRILTEGRLNERAVIVAASIPSLGSGDDEPVSDEMLAEYEQLDPSELPDVTRELVDRVALALAEIEARPRLPRGPKLAPDVRRAYQRKAGLVGGVALVVALVGWKLAPFITVLALPVVVLCGTVIALHAVALYAEAVARRRRGA